MGKKLHRKATEKCIKKRALYFACIFLPLISYANFAPQNLYQKQIEDLRRSHPNVPIVNHLDEVKRNNPNTKDAIYHMLDQHQEELNHHSIQVNQLLFPAKSNFSHGKVQKHQLSNTHFKVSAASMPFFVISNDTYSIHWAKVNRQYLNKIHAIGIVTNIDSSEEFKMLEKKTQLSLIVANIDGLENFVLTKHYPFLVYQGWVVQ